MENNKRLIYWCISSVLHNLNLTTKLGSGGEGTVYAVEGNSDICVKIYHEQKRTPELEAKLKAMIDAPPKDPTLAAGHYSICWPTNVVYEDEACTKFLGFTMPRIDRNIFKEYHLLCDKPGVTTSTCYRLEHFGTGFTYLHMYVVALNLASCVASIHNAGHAIGDLNDKNILVSTKDSKITIVDCDSFEIHAQDEKIFPCSVYMPEYSAPEVIQRKDIKNRQESDCFALSILIFKLLMLNTHPYASRGSSVEHLNTPGEKIASGYYPYEDYADLDVNPPAYALPYDIIPPNIKALFRRCFVEGQHDPEKRPSATQWVDAIKENYLEMSARHRKHSYLCLENNNHMYPLHLQECPWCAMREDYFPEPLDIAKASSKDEQYIFDYINKVLEYFAGDKKITQEEYSAIETYTRSHKIPEKQLQTMLKALQQKKSQLLIGDAISINPESFKFSYIGKFSERAQLLKIKNNYLFDSVIVHLSCDSDYITVVPEKFTLASNEMLSAVISYSPGQDSPLQNFTSNAAIQITIERKQKNIETYSLPLEIHYSTYSEFRKNVLKKVSAVFETIMRTHLISILTYALFCVFFVVREKISYKIPISEFSRLLFGLLFIIFWCLNFPKKFYDDFLKYIDETNDFRGVVISIVLFGASIIVPGIVVGYLSFYFVWGLVLSLPISFMMGRVLKGKKSDDSNKIKSCWVRYLIIMAIIFLSLLIAMV